MSTEVNAVKARVVSSKVSVRSRLSEIWLYRELLTGMIKKELKVKYKNSFLGFLWTMVNPALYLVVFWLVFTKFLPNGIPQFVIFFLAGLLVWNLFTGAISSATGSVVNHAGIVKKVYFPREILPLASVGASVVHYLLQLVVLVVALIAFQHNIDWGYVWLLPIALLAVIVFATSLGIFLSAINVYARDTQHLLELALLAWFWTTPVVYAYGAVLEGRGGFIAGIFKLNPMTLLILPFQRVIYGETHVRLTIGDREVLQVLPDESYLWYLSHISAVLAGSIIFFYIAMKVFDRAQGNFAEEL